jgi:hypothetical protein
LLMIVHRLMNYAFRVAQYLIRCDQYEAAQPYPNIAVVYEEIIALTIAKLIALTIAKLIALTIAKLIAI